MLGVGLIEVAVVALFVPLLQISRLVLHERVMDKVVVSCGGGHGSPVGQILVFEGVLEAFKVESLLVVHPRNITVTKIQGMLTCPDPSRFTLPASSLPFAIPKMPCSLHGPEHFFERSRHLRRRGSGSLKCQCEHL